MTLLQHRHSPGARSHSGFSLIELLISMSILMVVSGMVLSGTMDLVRLGDTMTNRAHMHAGVRNATALLQQEVGQAGRISLPGAPTLSAAAAIGTQTVTVSSIAGMFVGERLIVDAGPNEETVTLTAVTTSPASITAEFGLAHASGARIAVTGGFSAGVVPTTMANGSSGTRLKIVGDINGDGNGNMVFVEYHCDTANRRLTRNVMAYNAASKPAVTVEQILVTNLIANPPDTNGNVPPCFTYQERTFGGNTYVIGVAIMTTVETQEVDPVTKARQRMTKALLNVAPRNVYNIWQIASMGYTNRIQPLPASVVALLPNQS